MKEIIKFEAIHIVSEPGDFTRYDYVIIEHFDEYIIAPYVSTFAFPIRLLYLDIADITTLENCVEFIHNNNEFNNINPHTLLEVVTTIKEIHNLKFLKK